MSLSQFSVGQKVISLERGPITLEMLRKYAEGSGDYNPIHTDEAAAKNAGLPGIIAHGMLTAAFLADGATHFIASSSPRLHLASFQSRFKSMVFLGDTVSITGSVKSVDESALRLDLSAKNQKGEITTQAIAEFRLP
jgi:acyl dehydratase